MKKKWVLIGLLLVFLFTFPLYSTNYLLHIGIITLMFAFASQAWNIISGYSGQFSFTTPMSFKMKASLISSKITTPLFILDTH